MAELSAEERIALVRRAFEAYEGDDRDAVIELAHPDIEIRTPQELGNPGIRHGIDGLTEWLREWDEAWEEFHHEVGEIVPVGERHVVIATHQTARGRGSGVEVARDVGYVQEFRGGRCSFVGLEPSFEAALAVAREREGLAAESAGD